MVQAVLVPDVVHLLVLTHVSAAVDLVEQLIVLVLVSTGNHAEVVPANCASRKVHPRLKDLFFAVHFLGQASCQRLGIVVLVSIAKEKVWIESHFRLFGR